MKNTIKKHIAMKTEITKLIEELEEKISSYKSRIVELEYIIEQLEKAISKSV